MSDTPQELLARAQGGDKEAFERLYKEYFTPVYRYLYRRLSRKEDAEDLTQSVFLRLATTKARYEIRDSSLLAYLFTVARNILIDFRRKESHGILYDDTLVSTVSDSIHKSHDALHHFEVSDAAQRALSLLDDLSREVVTLRFQEGMSSREIAVIVNKSEDAVRQIQSRAMKKLRSLVDTSSFFS